VKYIVNIFKSLLEHYLSLFLSICKVIILVGAMAKNGSFGFAEGSACGRGKTKCAICAVAIQNILCGGKKIKTQKGRQ
jgi:hypothetical protein